MNKEQPTPLSSLELLEAGEKALEQGDSRRGFELLERASVLGVEPGLLHRLAGAFASAARFQSRQPEVLDWIERSMHGDHDPVQAAALHRARIAVCSRLDVSRVEALVQDALAAAERIGDNEAYASILASASFSAYRRGDARGASKYAEQARDHDFEELGARYEGLRAQMFGAVVLGDLEQALNLLMKARATARELDNIADVANESNNLSECYLELGCPVEARACADLAIELAQSSGDRSRELMARVLSAIATAEIGRIDEALELFPQIESTDLISSIDAAAAHSYWLLERGAAGDSESSRTIALEAIDKAARAGISNRLTELYCSVARSFAREAKEDDAVAALEHARQAADRAEMRSQLLLALAVAEVLPVSNPKRKVVLNHARARILRNAQKREDPRAYCTDIRLNRRLLELSGGVPSDLPHAG